MSADCIQISGYYLEDSKYLWCTCWKDSYLYKIDLEKGIINEVVQLLDNADMPKAFNDILAYKNYFVMIPGCADYIVFFDQMSHKCEQIALPHMEQKIGTSEFKFFTGKIYGDCLYLFGYSYPAIVKLDLVEKKLTVLKKWLKDKNLIFNNEVDGCFHMMHCQLGDKLYFPFMNANAVMELDLPTGDVNIHIVGNSRQRYISIEWDGTFFWLIPRDGSVGSIIKWNPQNDFVEYDKQYPKEFNYEKYAFYRTVNVGDKILLFAHRGNMNISIDISTGKMEKFPDLYDSFDVRISKYTLVQKVGEKIFIVAQNECIFWDYVTGKKESVVYSLSEDIQERYENKNFFNKIKNKLFVYEKEDGGLSHLIRYLESSEE